MSEAIDTHAEWPARPWLLAALGGVSALLVHLVISENGPETATQGAIALFIGCFAALLTFTVEKRRWQWALGFSAAGALAIALIAWWNGTPNDWSEADTWRLVSALLAVAIAAPLFQTARDREEWRFPYVEVHAHAWTNVMMFFAAWAFVGVTFLLAFLLSELFGLIGIRLIREALDERWFGFMLAGAALGAAIGVFHKRTGIIRMLLKVVVAVLGVLAPVLGAGLVLFLLSLPFTGLSALWEATKSTTPILLSCVIGALVLANVVIGDSEEDESHFPPLRFGAMALAACALPLTIIAAISTGARIKQYGFTPDRLWALVFVVAASAYGLAYLVALLRGRMAWASHARVANLRLAFGMCGIALFLALPIVSFNAISAADQVARLRDGRTPAGKFDWAALRFDFGAAGRAAVKRLAASPDADIRAGAAKAIAADNRWALREGQDRAERAETIARRLRVLPTGATVSPELSAALADIYACRSHEGCTLFVLDPAQAFVISEPCRDSQPSSCVRAIRLSLREGQWKPVDDDEPSVAGDADIARDYSAGAFAVREVKRRQLFIGDTPVGKVFE